MSEKKRPDEAELRKVVNRLKRARGQLTAVIDAMETDADCRDVIIQLAAVGKAIDRAGFAVISSALQTCLAGDDADAGDDRPTVAELEKLFLTLA
ncbi:metal-sensitive transcriptional regulator [Microbacterium istanbulense]|uniref:Metal-sensitive transcriptional regulator n=1 Tax=Microbacterium istanbulense TaxID=3122049 RepID=A0ABU8LMD4_9MICO